jgi:hypothetical protein
MGGRMHVRAFSHPGQSPGIGGWVGLVAGLDGCGRSNLFEVDPTKYKEFKRTSFHFRSFMYRMNRMYIPKHNTDILMVFYGFLTVRHSVDLNLSPN